MSLAAIKSARRVFEVLEYFDAERRPLSLKAICDRLGYPPSSGAGLLKSLMGLGYLEYDKASRTYLPTLRVAALGGWVVSGLFGGLNIIALMEWLRDETGETVILAARSDISAQYIHVVDSNQALSYAASPGVLAPLAASGFGRLLLSAHSDEAVREAVRRIDTSPGAGERAIDTQALLADLAAIRRDGYAVAHEPDTGVGTIGVLLPATPFGRRFALGVGGPSERIAAGKDYSLALLQETAAQFAEVLADQ